MTLNARADDRNWFAPLIVAALCVPAAMAVGASTNFINGLVSDDYFTLVIGPYLDDSNGYLIGVIRQGLFESCIVGMALAVIIGISTAAITGCRGGIRMPLQCVAIGIAVSLSGWLLGGCAGTFLAILSPPAFRGMFQASAYSHSLRRFAWVGGSINGAYLGALLAVFVIPMLMYFRLKRTDTLRGFPVDVSRPD